MCTICNTVLSTGDVKEVEVGVPLQAGNVDELLFQAMLETSDFKAVSDSLNSLRATVTHMETFVTAQVVYEAKRHQASAEASLRDKERADDQLVRELGISCFATLDHETTVKNLSSCFVITGANGTCHPRNSRGWNS